MKVGDIRDALLLVAAALGPQEQHALNVFCEVIPADETRSLSQFLKAAEPTPFISQDGSAESISDVHDALKRFIPFAHAYAKPAAFAKDLNALVEMLARHRRASVPDFIRAAHQRLRASSLRKSPATSVRDDVVANYVKELEDTYKNKTAFAPIFARLKADKKVRAQEAASIANRFAHETAASTARDEALDRILQKHELYVASAAGGRAMSGQSAA